MKTYWLSFADEDSGRNLGVCVVEVSVEQAAEAISIAASANPDGFPEGHEWIVAAIGQSVLMECNPGGDVQAIEVDPSQLPADLPRNRVIQEAELKRRGWA
jgi:hypothetical protein